MTIQELMERSYNNASNKGFHDEERPFSMVIALIHSEVSEALEEHREHGMGKEVAEEFADIMIRVADAAVEFDIPLVVAIQDKLAKNEKRPRMHGKRY